MKRRDIVEILNEICNLPIDSVDDTDLTNYIEDSIDLGDVLANIEQRYDVRIPLLEFRNKRTLSEFLEVIENHTNDK